VSASKGDNAGEASLTHVDAQGQAHMVDVSEKAATVRRAVAEGRVRINEALAQAIEHQSLEKGDLFSAARLAGIQAAKRTDTLIPLCHSLPLDHVDLAVWLDRPHVKLRATVSVTAKTGVEMEALTAVSVAALTVIDMGKALDKQMCIEAVELVQKSGGKSDFDRDRV
jgi:cyclic pyranopterin phosphate synthase